MLNHIDLDVLGTIAIEVENTVGGLYGKVGSLNGGTVNHLEVHGAGESFAVIGRYRNKNEAGIFLNRERSLVHQDVCIGLERILVSAGEKDGCTEGSHKNIDNSFHRSFLLKIQ